jgi:integrase/recombinase XerC
LHWCQRNRVDPVLASHDELALWLVARRHFSPNTVRNNLIALRAFFRYTVACGLRPDDPTQGLRAPKVHLPPIEPYPERELLALLGAARRPKDKALILLLIATGLRASEVLRIHEEDIDWAEGTIRVWGKGNKPRLVAPGDTAMQVLKTYLDGRCRNIWQDGIETPAGLRSAIRRLADRAGIEHANTHRFRHSFAAGFLEAGGSEGELQRILGHSSLQMSLHYAEGAREKVALRAQRRFNPADRLLTRPP